MLIQALIVAQDLLSQAPVRSQETPWYKPSREELYENKME